MISWLECRSRERLELRSSENFGILWKLERGAGDEELCRNLACEGMR